MSKRFWAKREQNDDVGHLCGSEVGGRARPSEEGGQAPCGRESRTWGTVAGPRGCGRLSPPQGLRVFKQVDDEAGLGAQVPFLPVSSFPCTFKFSSKMGFLVSQGTAKATQPQRGKSHASHWSQETYSFSACFSL